MRDYRKNKRRDKPRAYRQKNAMCCGVPEPNSANKRGWFDHHMKFFKKKPRVVCPKFELMKDEYFRESVDYWKRVLKNSDEFNFEQDLIDAKEINITAKICRKGWHVLQDKKKARHKLWLKWQHHLKTVERAGAFFKSGVCHPSLGYRIRKSPYTLRAVNRRWNLHINQSHPTIPCEKPREFKFADSFAMAWTKSEERHCHELQDLEIEVTEEYSDLTDRDELH